MSTTSSTPLSGAAATSSASQAAASLSAVLASASAALAAESRVLHGDAPTEDPPLYKLVGIALAVGSGVLIGSSFVWKKKGLIASQHKYGSTAGQGHHYLKSALWWTGMTVMVLGEIANFAAYMFAPAILVTPMGALSVVICAILSHVLLKESLTLFGSIGCFLCLCGSIIIALNGPEQHASGDINLFRTQFLAVGFLIWMGLSIALSLGLAFVVAPRYGNRNMLVYIGICSLIGGLSVSTTSGLGSAILLSVRGENQFKHWFTYILLAFVVCTLLVEINFLNKALSLFNTAMVTPTYYVLFTTCTLISSIILFQGLQASALAILTMVLGFLVICAGIILLQLSKVDPEDLTNKPGLDRRTTMLLRASQSHISHHSREKHGDAGDVEEPGLDTVRGGMGVVGSLLRARSSRRIASGIHTSADEYGVADSDDLDDGRGPGAGRGSNRLGRTPVDALGRPYAERYQLYDAPMGGGGSSSADGGRAATMPARRGSHISFASHTTGGGGGDGRPPLSAGGNASAGSGLSVPGAAGGSRDVPSIILKDRPLSSGGVQQYPPTTTTSATHLDPSSGYAYQYPGPGPGSGSGSGSEAMTDMRRYGTEPPLASLAGIREASGESGSSQLEAPMYVDPYARHGGGGGAGAGAGAGVEGLAMPVLLRGNGSSGSSGVGAGSDIRTMWGGGLAGNGNGGGNAPSIGHHPQPQPLHANDSASSLTTPGEESDLKSPLELDSPTLEGGAGSPAAGGGGAGAGGGGNQGHKHGNPGRRWGIRLGGGGGGGGAAAGGRGGDKGGGINSQSSSDSEEERLLLKQQGRGRGGAGGGGGVRSP